MEKREIKFRGQCESLVKDKKGNELMTLKCWVYGFLVSTGDKSYIFEPNLKEGGFYNYLVLPETIGQFTGLKDKNGKEIYEGDILSYKILDYDGREKDCEGEVKYVTCFAEYIIDNFSYKNSCPGKIFELGDVINDDCDAEIIGNIYDRKDLLEGVK